MARSDGVRSSVATLAREHPALGAVTGGRPQGGARCDGWAQCRWRRVAAL